MATQNSSNNKFTNNADGFDIAGGTTARKLTVSGGDIAVAGSGSRVVSFTGSDITFAGTGSAVITFPSATATLAITTAGQTFTGVQAFTSPDTTTSITTASTSFTAWAGATTLLTIGGTGASASLFAPSTLDTSSSTTGAIRTSGGISSAKGLWIGTFAVVGTQIELGHATDTTISRVSAGVIAVEGNNIMTVASSDVITGAKTFNAAMIVRTLGSDPQDATPGNRPAGTVKELAFYNDNLYFCTNSATPTWKLITSA